MTAAEGFSFSQLTEGQELWDAVTITETHVVTAASIFNDPGPNHVNQLQAEASRLGQSDRARNTFIGRDDGRHW